MTPCEKTEIGYGYMFERTTPISGCQQLNWPVVNGTSPICGHHAERYARVQSASRGVGRHREPALPVPGDRTEGVDDEGDELVAGHRSDLLEPSQ